MSALADASVPVPETRIAESWVTLLAIAAGEPIVVKTLDGNAGRGVNVLISPGGVLPTHAPFPGPFIAQRYLPNSSTVQKLYIAGPHTSGLLKSSPLLDTSPDSFVPFKVDGDLNDLAARVAETLELDVFGIDVIRGPLGPTVFDVSPFPGFRGISHAGRRIAEHILAVSQSRA